MNVRELAREGLNTVCVDCSDFPWGGGMRCLKCFQAAALRRKEVTEHRCIRHDPSPTCYQLCRCRCDECKESKRAYAAANR